MNGLREIEERNRLAALREGDRLMKGGDVSSHPLCPAREDFCHTEQCRYCAALRAAVLAERARCAAVCRSVDRPIGSHPDAAVCAAEIERRES